MNFLNQYLKRWEFLKKERLIYNIRKHQDLNWIEMNITEGVWENWER